MKIVADTNANYCASAQKLKERLNVYSLPEPTFDSELVSLLFEIERLRANIGIVTTPTEIFLELKNLFDTLMSVISARIEGNHTTIFEALENKPQKPAASKNERFKEINNVLEAAHFIDQTDFATPLSHSFIRELHSLTVAGLNPAGEGDSTPGQYRTKEVAITGSSHKPPLSTIVHAEMSALIEFANIEMPLNKQMMQIAQSHHRFAWIHPFSNGNGRVSRLFTYAMMRRTIFSGISSIALNPTSVFGNDRNEYLSSLTKADALNEAGDIEWATFFSRGIKNDLARLNHLQDHDFVTTKLLQPVMHELYNDNLISKKRAGALLKIVKLGSVKAADLTEFFPGTPSSRTREINKLIENKYIRRSPEGSRFYTLNLSDGPLAFKLIKQLDTLGFLPPILANDQ